MVIRTSIQQRNQILDSAGLKWFGFRLPGLWVDSYFYYKQVNEKPYVINYHKHHHWEVSRLITGKANYRVCEDEGDFEFHPHPDKYLVIPPEKNHRWHLEHEPLLLNSWHIQMRPEDCSGEMLLKKLEDNVIKSRYQLDAHSVQIQGEALLEEISKGNFPPGILGPMVNGVARMIVGCLLGTIQPWPQELVEQQDVQGDSSLNLAKKIEKFLELNLQNPIKLVDMESHFHYSGRHLNRIFHTHYHKSIGQHLRDRRYELALRWLATTNRSVKDIALSLGYGTVSHFCRYFRKKVGKSPIEYRIESHNDDGEAANTSWEDQPGQQSVC